MILTILHPHLLAAIRSFPVGLKVLTSESSERPILIVKGVKEAILAARVNRGFAVYVAPVTVDGAPSIALITAFFDVPDEPMIVRSPLFADEFQSRSLLTLLSASEIDVHFFDEHSRELLAYRATLSVPKATRDRIGNAQFGRSSNSWRAVDDQMQEWFAERTDADDQGAIRVTFVDALMPEDIVVLDGAGVESTYVGANLVASSVLVRKEPGPMQEHDIALLLQRIFSPEQIIRGPLRVHDREEVADLLVITEESLIFFQAKDSPNTEQVLANPLWRKRATALKSLKKALDQLRGAIRYAKREEPMRVLIAGQQVKVPVTGLRWRAIAVVKELFNDEYGSYSPPVLRLSAETSVPSVALDYAELIMYTANLTSEASFIEAIDTVYRMAQERGQFPRLRIGPQEVS